jgi:hypothetical protein
MRDWVKTLIIVLIVFFVTNISQFIIWKVNMSNVKERFQQELSVLQETIKSIGPFVDVYSVRSASKPGDEILDENLSLLQIPAAMINDTYILDPSLAVGKFYKVAVHPGTPLTSDLLMEEELVDSVREMDIIANTWPIGLQVGDYIDFEITYPFGENYVVLSHVRVSAINNGTIKAKLTSTERHLYGASLVDYFVRMDKGSSINMVKYTEPGIQLPAEVTYSVPKNILAVITQDPNVIDKVDTVLNSKRRSIIDAGVTAIDDDDGFKIASGRTMIGSTIERATNNYFQNLKELADKAAWEAFEKAGEQQAGGQQQPLEIEEGVVE